MTEEKTQEVEQPKQKVYNLDEAAIAKLELENRQRALQIDQNKIKLEELEAFLDKGIMKKRAQAQIDKIKMYLETKKDDDGKDIPESDTEALEIQLASLQKSLDAGLETESLRLQISGLRQQIELNEKNHKVAAKQIRERKIVYTQ